MADPLSIVITAASSGIGRATAEAFARTGARLMLAARGEEALDEVARACRACGAEVHVVPTDITDVDAVRKLVRKAEKKLGTIDLWVALAGVGAVGAFHQTPIEAHERTVRTNLIGRMNELHAVLPVFLAQQRGTFVNMISLGGFVSTPYAASYGASKAALKGLTEAVRGELGAYPRIHLCDVYPAFIDTPGLAHAANYTGRAISAPPPVVDARRVADAIVRLAQHPRATVTVGASVVPARLGHAIAPHLTARAMGAAIAAALKRAEPRAPTDGNLFDPPSGAQPIDGGLRTPPSPRMRGWAVAALGAAALIAGGIGLARARAGER